VQLRRRSSATNRPQVIRRPILWSAQRTTLGPVCGPSLRRVAVGSSRPAVFGDIGFTSLGLLLVLVLTRTWLGALYVGSA
jgi:hypothetical protein